MTELIHQSRRGFLTALAATGGIVATSAGMASAAPGEPGGDDQGPIGIDTGSVESAPRLRSEAFPAPVAGTNYTLIGGSDFHPQSSTMTWSKGSGQLVATAGVYYSSLSEIPHGARITEVIFAFTKSVAYPGDSSFFLYQFFNTTAAELDLKSTAGLPQQTAEQYLSLTVANNAAWVIDNQQEYTHWLVATLGGNKLNSVRVGWTLDVPQAFRVITPKRVYDSRFIAPAGPIGSGTNRVVSIANGYANDSATLDLPDVVPAGAKAIAYNVTVVNTVNTGYLSVNPGDAVAPGGSTINWFAAGQVLANGVVVKLDGSRQVKVFCGGGGSADFLIDILGYYV